MDGLKLANGVCHEAYKYVLQNKDAFKPAQINVVTKVETCLSQVAGDQAQVDPLIKRTLSLSGFPNGSSWRNEYVIAHLLSTLSITVTPDTPTCQLVCAPEHLLQDIHRQHL